MIPKEWLKGNHALAKEVWEPLVIPAIVILVGLSAFALGRLSATAEGPGPGLFESGIAAPSQQ